MSRTPFDQGHFAGWCIGNSLRFTGHTPNPYAGADGALFADEWDAGYWDGFHSGMEDHRDAMRDCGRAA